MIRATWTAMLTAAGVVSGVHLARADDPPPTTAVPAPPAAVPAAPEPPAPDGRPVVLTVGSSAPGLTIAKWLRGKPPEAGEGVVQVVEFWATWCGPSRRSMAGLSRLHAANPPDRLVVIGVCGTDSHGETVERIERFLERNTDRVGYRIALDDRAATRAVWLGGARIMQIPAAFVVAPDGRIAWIGNPATSMPAIERAVERLLAGTFDFEAAIEAARTEAGRRAEIEAAGAELQARLRQAVQSADHEATAVLADALVRLDAQRYGRLAITRFEALLTGLGRDREAYGYARDLIGDRLRDDAFGLAALAEAILRVDDPARRDLSVARHAAERADVLVESEDAPILDTLARVRFEAGDKAGAVRAQELAVARAPLGTMKDDMTRTLDRYREAMK